MISNIHYVLDVHVEDTINDEGVRDVSPNIRKCRFPDEPVKGSFTHLYSFNACVADCIMKIQNDTCGCTEFRYTRERNK